MPPKRRKLKAVTSGIGFDEIDVITPSTSNDINNYNTSSASHNISNNVVSSSGGKANTTVTSHTARVYLAGAGFLADAYDLFVINLVLRLLRDEYPQYAATSKIHYLEGCIASAALFGSIVGQLVAGNLADILGRKKIFVATAVLITLGSFMSASTFDSPTLPIYFQISFCRFFLGMGVGGEYPLAATVTSESSSAKSRGSLMCAVFAMQGVGSLLSIVVVVMCLTFGMSTEFTWRFSLAFGSVPVMIAFPWRLYMHETETFERVQQIRSDCAVYGDSYGSIDSLNPYQEGEHQNLEERTAAHPSAVSPITQHCSNAQYSRLEEIKQSVSLYKWHLFGTAACWYLLDLDFYANGLFNHEVTANILSGGKTTTAIDDAVNSLLVVLCGFPGYILCVYYIDSIGRKTIQLGGFACMAVLFAICGYWHDWFLNPPDSTWLRKYCYLGLYSLTFLFSNFGPNTTTFVIPGEIFPPEVKATCHGFSAACGKLGAASGAIIFPILMNSKLASEQSATGGGPGMRRSMFFCSLIAFTGATLTYYFTPEYGQQELEDVECLFPLTHTCLHPSLEQLGALEEVKKLKSAPYTMVEYIDSSDNYGFGDYFDRDEDDPDLGIELEESK